jgi:hypothetical protein
MNRRFGMVTVLLAVSALAAAGCGSSSKSKTSAQRPASTPPAPQTPSTATGTTTTGGKTTPGNVIPSNLSASTPITSPALRDALIKKLATVTAIPQKDDAPIADCVIKKLKAQGIQTYGDANKRLNDVRNDAAACTKQVLAGG